MELFKGKNVAIAYGVAALLLAVGTFADLQISGALTMLNGPVAAIAASFGELPWALSAWIGAGLMLSTLKGRPMAERGGYYLLMAAALLMSSYYCFKEPYKYLEGGLVGILGVAAEVAICILGAAFAYGNADGRNTDAVRRVALTMLLVGMLSIIVVNIVKGPWGRPRYRSIVATEGLDFRPWYVIGTSERDAFEGILAHDEFKSFPSGHSCSAAAALLLSLLPVAVPRLRGKEHTLLVVGIIWPLLIMFFRIVAGAHFLSDVLCGALVSYTVFLILYQLIAKKAVE